ncbi:MAG: PaaI family thioesterase [Geminicoccaceae bacterium]|nr:MAG: PaaI family thioesterase [Geminicoccaceae bacterium]
MTADSKGLDEAKAAIVAAFARSPVFRTFGFRDVAVLDDGSVTAVMPLSAASERREGSNQFHGGPIATFIDTIGDLAVGFAVGGGVPTINLRVDFLKPALGPELAAVARVRRLGRSLAVADIDVTDGTGSLVAIGRGSFGTRPA